jgi:hypothetical protein
MNAAMDDEVWKDFTDAVNLTAAELEKWLDTDESKKVVGYVHRHLPQRPAGDVRDTTWRHSLMNWGHDPAP